jgi:hypothetical protein
MLRVLKLDDGATTAKSVLDMVRPLECPCRVVGVSLSECPSSNGINLKRLYLSFSSDWMICGRRDTSVGQCCDRISVSEPLNLK